MGDKIIMNFDESGNLGRQGRYFTIACVETDKTKPLANVMKKAILKTKKTFPSYASLDEIKASHASPIVKDYFLRKIASKDNLGIRYIVADLHHVKQSLKDDENLLYNFMLKLLIAPIAKKDNVSDLVLNLDKRTIKVKSTNSFEDYIKLQLNYEMDCQVNVSVQYLESHTSYAIQAADFIANAVNANYERNQHHCYDLIQEKIVHKERFPHRYFGKSKVVNI